MQLKAKTVATFRRATGALYERKNKQSNRAPQWMGDVAQPGGFPNFIGNEIVGAMAEASGTRITNAPKPRSNPYSPMPPRLERLNGTAR